MNIGEFILYDRRLSPAERRQTTAYLLKKWRNQDFPSGTAAAMASLSYPSSETAVIDVDGTVAVGVLSGGNGELVKRGAGSVAVADARALGTLSTISVEEGALNISLDAAEMTLASLQTAALFDYDASVAASFSNEVTVVNGVSRTNVISWADAQGKADKIAYTAQVAGDPTLVPEDGGSLTTRSSPTVEHPTLISVEMPDGQFRPTVDFGALGLSSAEAGAGMHMKRINTGIREIHTMFADTDSAKRGIIVGGRKEDSGFGYCFQRDGSGNGYLLSSSAKDDVKNGYAAIDGVTVAPLTTSLPAGFHLVSFAPRSNMKAATLAMDRTARCGGCRISEQIAFTRALSTGERTILQKHLLRKWLGTARELVANLDSIEVAAGASLSLGDVAVSAETMTGGGTVSASEIRAVSHLILTPSAGPLVAHGTVTFANDTVEIEFAEDLKNLAFGEHTVFSADEITNGTLSMTLAAGVSPRVVPLLMRNGNEIVLRISPRGTRIILR